MVFLEPVSLAQMIKNSSSGGQWWQQGHCPLKKNEERKRRRICWFLKGFSCCSGCIPCLFTISQIGRKSLDSELKGEQAQGWCLCKPGTQGWLLCEPDTFISSWPHSSLPLLFLSTYILNCSLLDLDLQSRAVTVRTDWVTVFNICLCGQARDIQL